MRLRPSELLICFALLALCGPSAARESDRGQPMNIEAQDIDATLADDSESRLTGDVLITQGTLRIGAASAVITRTDGEIVKVLLEGKPASLQQEQDDGTPMSARAARIAYDVKSENILLTGNVAVDQAGDSMRGERIAYDLKSGRMNAGGAGQGDGRIRMTIQPRPAKAAEAAEPDAPAKQEGGQR
jgi:lipopolysaccharide export system protein LptA